MRPLRWILLILILISPAAWAHPIGYSGMRFLVWQDKARAILTIHTRDMTDWFPPTKYHDYVNDVCKAIIEKPDELLDIQFDGVPIATAEKRSFSPETGMIQVELTYPIKKMPAELTIWSKHLIRLPAGHQQLLIVEDMRGQPQALSGPSVYEGSLSREEDGTTVDVPAPPPFVYIPATNPTTAAASMPALQPETATVVANRPNRFTERLRQIIAVVVALAVIFIVLRNRPSRTDRAG